MEALRWRLNSRDVQLLAFQRDRDVPISRGDVLHECTFISVAPHDKVHLSGHQRPELEMPVLSGDRVLGNVLPFGSHTNLGAGDWLALRIGDTTGNEERCIPEPEDAEVCALPEKGAGTV